MKWQDKYRNKLVTPEQAAKLVKPGNKIVMPLIGKPVAFGLALANRRDELEKEVKITGKKITILSHWTDDFPFLHKGWDHIFDVKDGFILRFTREGVKERRIDWVPSLFGLSDGERQKAEGRGSVYHYADFSLLKITPPNENGYSSFSYFPWYSPTSAKTAKLVIAEVDPNIPWCFGEYVHMDEIDYLTETPAGTDIKKEGGSIPLPPPDEFEKAQVIGANVASLIEDGDVLEIGTGTATEAILSFLDNKNDLGIDSELVFAQIIQLMKQGVITNKRKNINEGKVVNTCLWVYPGDPAGIEALEFVKWNPAFEFRDVSYICNVPRIAANNNQVAINAAIAVDLKGQAVIDHLGSTPISGPGGQVEYCIGSHYSKGGKSILCLLSTAKGDTISRIVPMHEKGTGIHIPLTYVDYLVTEHGVANLECKSIRERSEALISVADPRFRDELREAAKKMFWP